jgi:hypothetical protein
MGVYTYTLRTKTQNLELPGGDVVAAHVYGYLCRSNDHDMSWMWPGDYGYKTAVLLNAQIERAQERFYGVGPVYVITEHADQGDYVYRAEDAEKAAVWYDCNCPTETEGVTKVGRLGPRVRRGRRLVWTVMTDEECVAFDKAVQEKFEAEQREMKRRAIIRRVKEHAERCAAKRREAQEASLNSAGL